MKLGRLRGENFRSFKEFDLDLNVRGLIAVVGENGAGKSSIFGAVEWALYGPKPGPSSTPSRRDGTPEGERCWVELEFECAGRVYTVYRDDKTHAKLTDAATGAVRADGVRAVSQEVAVILGLDRDMFCGTFYARQNEIQALDSKSEAERRAQLERLLGIERLRRAQALASAFHKEQRSKVATLAEALPDVDQLAAEVAQIEQAARQGDPAVQAARERQEKLAAERQVARDRLASLRAQAEQAHARRLEAQQAQAAADREQVIRDGLAERAAAANAAAKQLAALSPVAAEAEQLAAREREMLLLRDNHERATTWRGRLDDAMARAAELADRLAALDGPPVQLDALSEQTTAAERRLEELRAEQARQTASITAAQARIDTHTAAEAAAARAATLDEQIAAVAGAPALVEELTAAWQKSNERRAELSAQLRHDTEHRDAILADGEDAACPRCKREYGSDFDAIRAAFDDDIASATAELEQLDRAMGELAAQGKTARADAERAHQLAGERRALGEVADAETSAAAATAARQELDAARGALSACERALAEQTEELAAVRSAAAATAERSRNHQALTDALASARRDIEMFSAELSSVGSNGYDPDAHQRLSTELTTANEAAQRCAALRDAAASQTLLTGRLSEQDERLAEARAVAERLASAAADIAVTSEVLAAGQRDCERLDDEVDRAGVALRDAEVRATAENAAAEQARGRLNEARKSERALAAERREERVRAAVAAALAGFRDEAARRARPTLIAQTSALLGTVTAGRYSAIRISDDYRIELVDDGVAHPLRRFSGGEQDLAGLCVRLGLSQMAASQRGVEVSFSILDEVFGSQDPRRRIAITEQLRSLLEGQFEQVFVITHTEDVLHHCDLMITVTRDDDGISTAEGPSRVQVTRTHEPLPAVGEAA